MDESFENNYATGSTASGNSNAFAKLIDTDDEPEDGRPTTPGPSRYYESAGGRRSATPGPMTPRPQQYPKRGGFNGSAYRSQSSNPRDSSGFHARAVSKSSGRNAFRSSQPSNSKVDLPVPYGELKKLVPRPFNLPPNVRGEQEIFKYISDTTGAFIPPPNEEAFFIGIWGPPAQTREAERLIRYHLFPKPGLAQQHKKPSKTDKFAATNLKAAQKAEQAAAVRRLESVMQSLREKPDNAMRFPESLLFLWPDDEFPMKECLGGDDMKDFDDLRQKYGCHIYRDETNPSCLRVDADDHTKILKVAQGIRSIWANLLARTNVKVKIYLMQVPPVRADVGIDTLHRNARTFRAPRPYDPEDNGGKDWLAVGELLQAKNLIRLREGVERSLHALKYSKGHLRMRVNFGTFALREYQALRDGRTKYTYEEFRNMLLLSRTRGYLESELSAEHRQGLLARCMRAESLLAPFDPKHSTLERTPPSYAATFNFQEESSFLRLEVEFNRSHTGVYEPGNRRWLKSQAQLNTDAERPILQVGMIDFERSDWELAIKAPGQQIEGSSISRSLKEFSSFVQLERTETDEANAPGKRRVSFPIEKSQTLRSIQEKTAWRFRVKNSSYVLELARYDTYPCISSVGVMSPENEFIYGVPRVSEHSVTTWGASLYNTDWDNHLGQNAHSKRGENVHWKPSLKSFFPSQTQNPGGDVQAGFYEFVDLVGEVAQLLRPEHKLPPPRDEGEAYDREKARRESVALGDTAPFFTTWKSAYDQDAWFN
ncbi:hypothetical protein KEM55_001576 [Ascosphaera atra]|nr:hypothetical protein KEM55_001576 [Ascosphaera atra]